MTAAVRHREAMRRVDCPISLLIAALLISTMLQLPADQNRTIIPTSSPMSPTRLVKKAFKAASEFGFSSHQCPMSANEQTPTSSHPTIVCRIFSLRTKKSIDAEKRLRKAK